MAKDGTLSEPLNGVPKVVAAGQGGLLDVALDPDFTSNSLVYLTYSEPGEGGAGTAVARGKLGENGLDDVEVIFRQEPKVEGGNHFGSRLVFAPDGKLFVTLGERFTVRAGAGPVQRPRQDRAHQSRRLGPEGQSLRRQGGCASRNLVLRPPQSARRRHPSRDRQAVGDRIRPARAATSSTSRKPAHNYGWPVVSWGTHYDGEDIPDPPTHPEFADAIYHWNPVISPSGITFLYRRCHPGLEGQPPHRRAVGASDRAAHP